jgi:hypothetical protein
MDTDAAERFIYSAARLLERHRLAALMHGGPTAAVLDALRPYRNSDGGFGHALEPDVRSPQSETTSTLHALEVLSEIDALGDAMAADAADWIAAVADEDGGVPSVMDTAAAYPHAPWMVPSEGGSILTFALAAVLWEGEIEHPWRERASRWCWERLAQPDALGGYGVKFALAFLDRVPESQRAVAAIESLRPRLRGDGSIPVAGGTADERLTPLALSPQPGSRSRALLTEEQIRADLDRLESAQQDDGGWSFDWLAWSPGQAVEWRGIVTFRALAQLRADGRIYRTPTDASSARRRTHLAPRRRTHPAPRGEARSSGREPSRAQRALRRRRAA